MARSAPWVILLWCLAGCSLKPPHALLVVEDPADVAAGASRLAFGFALDALTDVPLDGRSFPVSITLTHPEEAERQVWVEARTASGLPVARSRVQVRFRRADPETATTELKLACEQGGGDETCDNGVFCDGREGCVDRVCETVEPPCAGGPTAACVTTACVEDLASCVFTPDHAACNEGSAPPSLICDPRAGCVEGQGCADDDACDDGAYCNGAETCLSALGTDGVCVPGVPPGDGSANAADEDLPCRVTGCSEALRAVVDQPVPDGTSCRLGRGLGVCRDGSCAPSVCGDGVVDAAGGEACDDGNANDGDGCTSACQLVTYTVTPWLGGGLCDGRPIDEAALDTVERMSVDSEGRVLWTSGYSSTVRRYDPTTGLVDRVAGNGVRGASADGIPALEGSFDKLYGVAGVPSRGWVVFADRLNHRLRYVGPDGVLRTLAGSGVEGESGDGFDARGARIYSPDRIAVAPDGSWLAFVDKSDTRVRAIDLALEDHWPIRLVAGSGGQTGGPLPSTSADLEAIRGIAIAADGTLYTSQAASGTFDHGVVAHTPDGLGGFIAQRVAGTGSCDPFVDGVDALASGFCSPQGLAVGALGYRFCTGLNDHRVVCVDDAGLAHHVAGTGASSDPDATAAPLDIELGSIRDVAAGPDGSLWVTGYSSYPWLVRIPPDGATAELVRRSEPARTCGYDPATPGPAGIDAPAAGIGRPTSLAVSPDGHLTALSESDYLRVGESGELVLFRRWKGQVMDFTPAGDLLCVSYRTVYRFPDPEDPESSYQALGGDGTSLADGVATTEMNLVDPSDIHALDLDEIVVLDRGSHRLRRIYPDAPPSTLWLVETLAGDGNAQSLGPDGPAREASLYFPEDAERAPDGSWYIAEGPNGRLRRLTLDGMLETVTWLPGPVVSFTLDSWGNGFAALKSGQVVRLDAGPDGLIPAGAEAVPIAGTGQSGLRWGPALSSPLPAVADLQAGPGGDLYLALFDGQRVIRLARTLVPPG